MSQRMPSSGTIHFYDVLDLIKLSTVKPEITTEMTVHSLAFKVGALAHLPFCTSLIVVYSRAGYYSYSVALFEEIPYKDVVVWNAMMTATVSNRCFRDAMNYFQKMIEEGIEFDSITLIIAISALSKLTNRMTLFRTLHCLGLKTGMLSDSSLCNALVHMYGKCGDLVSSECMFVETKFKDKISWNSIICSCLNNNHHEKSLRYFKWMASSGQQADNVSLSCAIAASTCLVDLAIGQAIHGWGIKLDYYQESPNVSVVNALISLYSQCGDIDAAYAVFRGINFKDLISWNTMINGFASNGRILEAFDLLREMQLTGSVLPDTVTILTILPFCAELREGKSVHGFTKRRELGFELPVMNCLMNMYSKYNSVKAAEYLFMSIPEKDLVSWNTMISGYSQTGNSKQAQLLFKKLMCWSSRCTLSTVLAVLPSCNSPEFLHFGISLHCWHLKLGFLNNIPAVNSLMCMYINCGEFTGCFALLQSIWAIANTACWNAIISGSVHNGYFLEALETFNLMRRKSHVTHDSVTLVSIISACGNLELVSQGKLCHGFSLKTLSCIDTRVQNALITMYGRFGEIDSAMFIFNFCCSHNLCSWNCIISALSQNKYAKRALQLFRCLNFEPNEITVATILSACTQLGVITYGNQIHAYVFRYGFYNNCFITAALLDMYSNCGRLDMALHVFQYSPEKSIAAWNSLISAYGFHSNGENAIRVFNEMIDSGLSPTKTTFINLLSACTHSGLVNEGLWYYQHMLDKFGVPPVTEHHVCLVDMLGRSGRLSEAYESIRRMPTEPDQGIWGAMLSACNYHGDVEMGRKVANILFCLEPANAGYYVSLANMYVAAGRWSDAVELRTIIQDKQLKKLTGYSLIDVDLG